NFDLFLLQTPCGQNFCLQCFKKMVEQRGSRKMCGFCRKQIPPKMEREPHINSAIVMAIRKAKLSESTSYSRGANSHFIRNQDRPNKAFTTEKAKKNGNANASCGKVFVTNPRDYFGPITTENDPKRNQGVLVGETWEHRMECKQWGAHLEHVGGIAGNAKHGAVSVALSGGYEEDEDHGDWFIYTEIGGRELKEGNKRTCKKQTSDLKFTLHNEALCVSCLNGYPIRVVREKHFSYAPQTGVCYDGIYKEESGRWIWVKPQPPSEEGPRACGDNTEGAKK
ncbi:hypothetical protein RD792_007842, partial [Penstemon davidsonii]